ncbi:MAG: methyltransferase domain-containing protein [Desulfovibrionaceae bacterium]|jgi:SAM-dependent methyltransferase|nr:methyltransferase domain-containing protein [Desulfovibrionaceae bacterium]
MWDEDVVRSYEGWFQTPKGRFAFELERRLLERMVSPWPRRGRRLLEIGCGTGLFLQVFYEAGFDVDGMDSSPAMLGAARRRMGETADLQVGAADHLPYADNEYDYVALVTMLEFVADPAAVLAEAVRVARSGVLVAFLNRWSLYYLTRGAPWPLLRRSMLRSARWFTPLALRRMLLDAGGGDASVRFATTLSGPTFSWRNHALLRLLNTACPSPFGAFGALRLDLSGGAPLTPLLAFTPNRA